ncbi:hypothetical protein PsYK624_114760 [Phanerochaete sordida]|uniref:Uncharacterized protein n=1 Tax=Phanerochaete sordida TaxID=48140 RepID=A0A9P3LHS2_9APHY|nr:hypothetical protein PsYK624_114760 [Phanerochaete sordida]
MSMVEMHVQRTPAPAPPHEPAGCSWSAMKDLAALVGPDDARTIHARLAAVARGAPPLSPPADADAEPEAFSAPNEVYILALSAALQRAADAQPGLVECRVRQVLRRLGLCLETCTPFFLAPAPPSAS